MSKLSKVVPQEKYTKDYFSFLNMLYQDNFKNGNYELDGAYKRCFLLADIKEGDTVLDVGAGRGVILFESHKHKAKVYGTDYADASIEIINDFMKKEGINNIHVKQATLPDLYFNEVKFDKIFFLDVIEHIYEPVVLQTLDNIYRVIKKGGYVVIHTDNKFYQTITRKILNFIKKYIFFQEVVISEHEKLHVNFQSLSNLKRKLEDRGFEIIFSDYLYPKRYQDIEPWTNIRNVVLLKIIYFVLKMVLTTPLRHLLCPTFDIKCRKL